MKLIASDFDGTLNRGGISERDRAAIASWRAAGNLFGIVTGRGGEFAEHATRDLGLGLDFVICSSGALIFDGTSELKEVYATPEEVAAVLEEEARAHGAIRIGRAICPQSVDGFCQISTVMKDDEAARVFAEAVNTKIPQLSAYQNGICVDIVGRGISKATGIARVAELHGVPQDHSSQWCCGISCPSNPDRLLYRQPPAQFHRCLRR
jgi:hydroxymethylpyrimidine pyrophosphatase-like HAD family hydrolase